MTAGEITAELRSLGDPEIAQRSQRFFKTGEGEYGEGDEFLGIKVPVLRAQVARHMDTSLPEVQKLLRSELHEVRLFALFLLVRKFGSRISAEERERIFDFYLANTDSINNWDLVDSSAHHIVGRWLNDRDRDVLYQLARSENLWERRIAMVSTFHFIRQADLDDTYALAALLVRDPEDLMHKAVGWMLREAGKRDEDRLVKFLDQHYQGMPRTLLRYAIEKFPPERRKAFLQGEFGG